MSDSFDDAQELEQFQRDTAIRQARSRNKNIALSGRCLSCNAEIEKVGRFCDIECREQFELEQKVKLIKGF